MKNIIKIASSCIFVLAAVVFMWKWGFCRFYVGPNEMAIITAKNGAGEGGTPCGVPVGASVV